MKTTIFLFMNLLFFSLALFSQDNENVPACKKDITRYCSKVSKGQGKIYECLQKNTASLSEQCKKHLSKLDKMQDQRKELCKKDAIRFCKNVAPGQGGVIGCLKKNSDKISEGCRNVLPK